MKRNKILSVFLCAIVAIASFLPTVFGESKDKPLSLAFLTNNPSDFWTIARAGCEQAVKEIPNVKLEFKMPADGTAAEQTRLFDDLLVKGIDGIALSPVDPANQTAMIDKGTEKALIITQDSDAPKSKRVVLCGDRQRRCRSSGRRTD